MTERTIFLQVSETQYKMLIEDLVGAVNVAFALAYKEKDKTIRKSLIEEAQEISKLIDFIGDQGSPQLGEPGWQPRPR